VLPNFKNIMKKKIAKLLQSEQIKTHARFKALTKEVQAAEALLEAATVSKEATKAAYRELLQSGDQVALMEKFTAFRQAKLMRAYENETLALAQFRLYHWLEQQNEKAKAAAKKKKPAVEKVVAEVA